MKRTGIGAALVLVLLAGLPARAADDRLERAVALQEQGDHDGAIAIYKEILATDPDSPKALAGLAFSAYSKGDWEGTVSVAEKLVATGEDCPAGVYLVIGSAYGMLGLWDKAEEVLLLGQSVWPDDEALRFHRAINLFAQGRLDDAIGQLERCIRRSPYRPEYWQALGDAMKEDGSSGRAFAAYARSLSLASDGKESQEIATRMWGMLFERRAASPAPAPGSTEASETRGMSLVGLLRRDDSWRNRTDAEFFAYALDTVLKLVSALNEEGKPDLFWGPFALAYFDDLRREGHLETLAWDIRLAADDPDAERWGKVNAEKLRRYRRFSERWAVNWNEVSASDGR